MSSQMIHIKDIQGDVSKLLQESSSLLPSTSSAIASTISVLYGSKAQAHTSSPLLLLEDVVLLASSGTAPPEEIRKYLQGITSSANAAANSLACGSILVGQSSESDEFGDLAFWLGEGSFSSTNESRVLQALELQYSEISPVDIDPSTRLPVSVSTLSLTPEVQKLVNQLSALEDPYSFSFKVPGIDGGITAYLLVGHRPGPSGGWLGLVGVGVLSD